VRYGSRCYTPETYLLAVFRYYMKGEGVRLYSQATWKMVVGDEGRAIVERYEVILLSPG